ncbi:MAG: replication factor C large subunit [Methanothrix sp.]|nr:replication factor C large subunit [Methanothrix sp.]MDD4446496.1 replication factor C large subunit [Methanothrix sp.]
MPPAVKWTEKYRPDTLKQVLGNGKAIEELRAWAASWERGSPITGAVILYGPAGTGKTSAALALAREFDWDYIEMNASDARTAGMIEKIAGPASRSMTFSGKPRLVILDEADNLHGTADRGGASAMLRLVRDTRQPVLLIANEYYDMEKPLRDAAKGIQFRSVRSNTIAQALREICRAEGVECDPDALMMIAERAGGDMRSGVNDLQAAAQGQTALALEDVATAERDVKSSIFKVLEVIFKGNSAQEALQASYALDESPEDLINWVDENLPLAYKGEDLWQGYERLARADVFLGRVRVRQNYGLWRYAGFLMTGGVQAAKAAARHGYVAFRPPSRWRRMGQTKKARNIRDSAAKKIGSHCHVSAAFVRAELMDFVGLLLADKKKAIPLAAQLELDADEIALLLGSTTSTKKVQNIFEEAMKMRAAEEFEEIELSWHGTGTAQQPLGGTPLTRAVSEQTQSARAEAGAVQVGASVAGAVIASAEKVSAVQAKPLKVEAAPPVGPQPEETTEAADRQPGSAAKPEGRKRGRPKKAESEGKAAAKATGKRQKSLFDF